jgi:3-phenylpropionate/cinnamic acid dioxygenase small subunit
MSDTLTATKEQVERFINREARLIDEKRYEEWLALFTEDGWYWLPASEERDEETGIDLSVLKDNRTFLAKRIWRLLNTTVPAQTPPSSTVHATTNLEVHEPEVGENGRTEIPVHCVYLVFETRIGDVQHRGLARQRVMAGRAEYRLVPEDDSFRIALKKIWLVDREVPIDLFAFIV